MEETNFPGWQIRINDFAAQVTTAQTAYSGIQNRGFIAVPMPPGTNTYTFHFDPPGLTTGILIFILTLLAIAFYLVSPKINLTRLFPHH